MGAKYYSLDQAPPEPWYQKRVGWFGKLVVGALVCGFLGFAVSAHMVVRTDVKSLAAETIEPKQLTKVTSATLEELDAENIIDLQLTIDRWVAEHPGQKWGIAVKSLEGARFEASYNADKEFSSASMYKLFLTLPLTQQIPIEHQKTIMLNIDGKQKSIATCVDLMLRLSDNPCGEAVGDYLNWSKAQKTLNSAGFKHTVFGKDDLKTSANDTAAFMEKLQGDMFTRIARETFMRSLREQRWREGIPAGCPGCTTANKTGSKAGVVHDAAIVQYSGGTYVLAIFSEGGSFKQIAELTGQIQQQIIDTTQ